MTSNPHESNEEVKGAQTFGTGYDERRRSRWLAPLPITIGVFLLVLLLLGAWLILRRSSGEQEVEPIVEVEVTPTERVEMREYVEAGGTLNALPGHEASFSSASAGRAMRVLVQVGQHVRAGQTLAELDRSVLAAQVRQAQAALQQAKFTAAQARTVSGAPSQTIATDQIRQAEAAVGTARANETLAQSNLSRQRRLFERGIAPRKDIDDAETQAKVTAEVARQAESALTAARVNAARGVGEARTQASVTAGGVEAAQAALDVARAEFARAAIRSPIAGTVTKRTINDGESVDPATPAFEVIDSASLDLVASVPAGYLDRIKTGDLAVVRVEALPDKEFTGGVVQVAPAVDSQTNTVAVRVRLANPGGELKAGLYASAHIAVEIHQNALVVPDAALVVEGDEAFVFVSQGEKVEKRKVTVGIRGDKRAEITDGLKEGERVVTTGAFGLGDGTRIKIVQADKEK
ncbi:MAG TPA: efflux RND transporter periplasmic adaptor subunit [Pyrinomonadaceae bacterium]|nr:efflux RND transporter periplasmic adaptor subunit [Pyrinomonadaceae bacterium]